MSENIMEPDAGFAALGLDPRLVSALAALGYEEPTPVQNAAIPALLDGHDLLGMAATGTGKTAAFALPMLQRIAGTDRRTGGPYALVLVPTRELAMQVAEAVHKYGKSMRVTSIAIYGGAPMQTQIRALARGVDVVVATPGRALDLINRRSLQLTQVQMVVLDEADEMLDMGFAEDLDAILAAAPQERQTALFSATLPGRISDIANTHLHEPVRVRIDREIIPEGEAPRVTQTAYIVPRQQKAAALGRVLDIENPTSAIVFCRTRGEVDELVETLNGRGYRAAGLHGGLSQEQRDRVMRAFRANSTDLLIATDVAARGLDVDHLSHVVNYDVPSAAESYVHRIGRTGRAGRQGVAITFAEPREHRLLRNIERMTRQKITIATVPSAADLRARRIERIGMAVREVLEGGGFEQGRAVVEALAQEFDILDIAAAGVVALSQAQKQNSEEVEIEAPRNEGREYRETSRPPREGRAPSSRGERPERGERSERSERAPSRDAGAPRPGGSPRTPATQTMARLWVGGGRKLKVRAGDIVGAMTGETGVTGAEIGAIRITDRYSLVDVPEDRADMIVAALRATTIKGKRLLVRRDRDV
jgi:ATP-dependent RNA helicase DeaD